MNKMFNEGDTIRSYWDGRCSTIIQVCGEILVCINSNGLIELMDFEVDLITKGEYNA